jgi:hypothetical protein
VKVKKGRIRGVPVFQKNENDGKGRHEK